MGLGALPGGRAPALASRGLLLGGRPTLTGIPTEPDLSPPCFDASGEFAIRAARSLDMPLSLSASYCFSFFTLGRLSGIVTSPCSALLGLRRLTRRLDRENQPSGLDRRSANLGQENHARFLARAEELQRREEPETPHMPGHAS